MHSTLGEHARQAGSLVAPDRLRFDFTNLDAVTPEQIEAIERQVNEEVIANKPIQTDVMSFDEATQTGAMALFGEKYGDTVRVVIGSWLQQRALRRNPCHHTGDVGLFLITSESSVASGIRRIEAVTGHASIDRRFV